MATLDPQIEEIAKRIFRNKDGDPITMERARELATIAVDAATKASATFRETLDRELSKTALEAAPSGQATLEGVKPSDAVHLEGCEHSRSPVWLCDCPRPRLLPASAEPVVTEAMIEAAVETAREHLEIDGDDEGPFIRFDSIDKAVRAVIDIASGAKGGVLATLLTWPDLSDDAPANKREAEPVKALDEDDPVIKALRTVPIKVFGKSGPTFLSMNEAVEVFNIVRSALLTASTEPVAEVIWFDPQLRTGPERAGKIIDASIAFIEDSPIGTKLYASPPASGAVEAYTPVVITNDEAGISELVLRDCPTYVAEEMSVRAVRDMADRSLIGFQWPTAPTGAVEATPPFTTGHCENHKAPGGCHLHNLHCGWPDCDRRPASPREGR